MKNREQYKRLIRFSFSSVIIMLQTAIFYYVWFFHFDQSGANFFVRGNYVLVAQYALLVFGFNKIYSGFKVGYVRLFEILFSHIMSVVCVNLFMYLELCLIGRWAFRSQLVPFAVMTIADLVVALLWSYSTHKLMAKLYPPKKLVLVYGHYSPDDLARKMRSRGDTYDICEKLSIDEDIELIKERILEYHCAILADIPDELRNHLLKFCFEHDVRCYCVPKISDIMIMHAAQIQQFDTSLLLMRNQGLSVDQQFMKRAFDIFASVIGIILASPFMLIIALAIKLYDGGPVFFKQERLTKDGKVFKVFKFRSMRVRPPEKEYCMTRKDDDRITPVGKIIRRLHVDELPQIFNILRGEMSLVGPRPECPSVAEEYCKMMPEFSYRLKVKGGLTGYAQVYGKYNTTPYDKLKLDLAYIERYSFFLDIKLIFLTFKVLFQKDNTEGIESWQTSAATKENLEKIGQD